MSKKVLSLLIVLVLAAAMMTSTAFAVTERYSHCGNGKPLNVRSGPGKEYPVVGSYAYGEVVPVDHDLGNGWSEVVWGSVPAYVMTSLLSKTYPGPYVKPSGNGGNSSQSSASGAGSLNTVFKKARFVTPYTVTVHGSRGTGSVNVRWAPSTDCSVIQAYAYGYTLQVIAELGDWSQVTDPVTGVTGFAMSKFLYR